MITPRHILSNLRHLDRGDLITSARYREQAYRVLADPRVNPAIKEAIVDRLYQADHLLALCKVETDESY
ncbi:hypothetical protein XM38_035140 [Halomicronema hongdechloris C2206]|uniref:Uncharacterized protein n=1 Tax=Halomicronema hongdechloris C2206 TaxID=1641165 RepID=A0A1Z3HQM3_9CYAN|nr:hypothetical protein [Halomicronema hongdechloris]ASC72556.1 hypothetical protein XM38_035140 [Halomicronema hongdechloris C2206]